MSHDSAKAGSFEECWIAYVKLIHPQHCTSPLSFKGGFHARDAEVAALIKAGDDLVKTIKDNFAGNTGNFVEVVNWRNATARYRSPPTKALTRQG